MKSISYKALELLVKCSGLKKLCQMNNEDFLKCVKKKFSSQKHTPPKKLYKKYSIEQKNFLSNPYYIIKPKNEASKETVFFIHGGGYIQEIYLLHWMEIDKIIEETKAKIYVPIYPLTPEHSCMETIEMMEGIYKIILKNHSAEDISILGDSAGGQIGLSFCQYIKTVNLPQPRNIILVSPLTEVNPEGEVLERMLQIEENDCMLSHGIFDTSIKYWTQGIKADNYLVSPVYGDFSGLAKISLFSGTYDILNAGVKKLIEAAEKDGTHVDYYEGDKMMHTWPQMHFSSESREGLAQIIKIIESR